MSLVVMCDYMGCNEYDDPDDSRRRGWQSKPLRFGIDIVVQLDYCPAHREPEA